MPRPHTAAKFLPPRPRHALLRQRLHDLLDGCEPARGVWLQGQAGAGKSTLAAAWAAGSGKPLAWFRVDATDADLSSAFGQLAALLGSLSRKRLPAAVLRPPPQADADALVIFARLFFRAFHAYAGPLVLVIDDAHTVAAPSFVPVLHAALDEAPAGSVVLVTSRQPPQGVMLEAAARGDLCIVEGHALDFTAEEAAALLAPRLGAKGAQALFERTGGWAAGLTLLASNPNANPNGGSAAQGAERTVADFFDQRVLGLLDSAQCQLLAAVSLLPEVDVAALQTLGLPADAAERLDALCAQFGFVQRLSPGQRCWRLHDLLKQALQTRWPNLGNAAWRAATLVAAASLQAAQGRLLAAVELLGRAGEPQQALTLWRQQAAALLRQGRSLELQQAFAALDPALTSQDASALTQRGLAAWLAQNADTGDWFDQAWAALDVSTQAPATPARLVTAAAALNAQFSGWRSYAGRADWLQRFLGAWSARAELTDPDEGLRVDKSAMLVFLSHRSAPLDDDARKSLLQRVLGALAQPGSALDANVAVSASSTLVEWCNYCSDSQLLARLADLTPPWLALPGLAATTEASWWISYGWVSVRLVMGRSDLPEGEAAIQHGVALARAGGAPDVAFYGLSNLVAAAASRHDLALADQLLQQLSEVAAQRTGAAQQPTQQATLHLLAARLLTLRGDATTALVRITRALELVRVSDFPLSETWVYQLSLVQVLTALEREDEALALATEQALVFEGMRRDYLEALGLLAQMAQAWRLGRSPTPAQVQACISLAARHRWMAIGNHLQGPVARLAAAALTQGVERNFVQALVRQRRLPAPTPDTAEWPWRLRIQALGGFAVWADGTALDFGARPQKKPLDLLRILVARGPASVDTAALIDALWPEADGDRAKASLDMAVLHLRKLLGADEALRLEHGHLALNRSLVWVDAWAWQTNLAALYGGPLFGNAAPELAWAAARESLHGLYLRRCHGQGAALERQAHWPQALDLYRQALVQDALDEALHRGVIRCHLALDEPAAAQRAFASCCEQLQAGLGVRPAPATWALVAGLSA